MLADKNKRKELLRFIDQKTFDPILRLPTETYTGEDRKQFQSVKKQILKEKRKLHSNSSATEIKEIFMDAINANRTRGGNNRHDVFMQISTLPELKDKFAELCKQLEI